MPAKVRIPAPMQKLTQGKTSVVVNGATVAEVIDDLEKQFPGIRERFCDSAGKVKRFINIYVNQEDIRFADLESTKIKDGDEISIVPAIAGG